MNHQTAQPQQLPHQQNIQQQPLNSNNQLPPPASGATPTPSTIQNCIRTGCPNPAIVSVDWEDEYCSNECVTSHCRDVFANWVQSQAGAQQQQNFSAVK
jgi:hypothetical protein